MSEERRLVTVVFADVVGSTSLGETLDPEDVRALLGRFFGLATEVVGSHGGTLEKFIGDAVFAVFGMPQAHDDDPQRALSAALELRDGTQADETLRERLPIRLGVNTGEVVASPDPGRGDFLVVGDAVNVAARLQQAAEAWEILCSDRTASAARGAFSFGPPVDLALRGKSLPVAARPLLGRATERPRRQTPLVGRRADLALLELVARRAFAERRPFLVSITALPGVGKSRLVQEFVDRLQPSGIEARVISAQCLPYGQRLTYWPLRGLLVDLLGLSDEMAGDELVAALRSWLQRDGAGAAGEWADVIAATIGVGERDVEDRVTLHSAWRELITMAAQEQPLLVVIEDLHWASDSLLDLIEHLLQPHGELPLLVLALARPELLDRRRTWGGGRRNYVSLALEPLGDDDVGELVSHLLEQRDPELERAVRERAEGNPFFVGEMVRSLLERTPGGATTPAILPDTVQATVLARLDLLEPAARRLLQVGSIFGRSFRAVGVSTVDPELTPRLADLVDQLIEREMVDPARGDVYAFRHILVREVAYGTLPRVERMRLHRRAGDWLAAGAASREAELAELVALHYREAAMLGRATSAPGDSTVEAAAVEWLVKAAEAAAGAAGFLEASHHLQAAIELAPADKLPGLYNRLGDALGFGNRAAEAYLAAVELGRRQGLDANFLLRNLAGALRVNTRWFGGVAQPPSRQEMDRIRAEARELLPIATDERAKAIFHMAEGFFAYWVRNTGAEPSPEDIAAAEESARQALVLSERLHDASLTSAALDALAALMLPNRLEEALAFSARRLTLEPLDVVERGDAYFTHLWFLAVHGDLDEVMRLSDEGLRLAETVRGATFGIGIAAWGLYALALRGRWDEVPGLAATERRLWIDEERPPASHVIQGFYSALAVARARHDRDAEDAWRDVLEEIVGAFDPTHPVADLMGIVTLDVERLVDQVVAKAHRFPTERSYHLEHVLGVVTDRRGRVPEEALTTLIVRGSSDHVHILEGQARRALGLGSRRPEELRRALSLFQDLKLGPYVARVQIELGEMEEDEPLYRRGLASLRALGDLEYLERWGAA